MHTITFPGTPYKEIKFGWEPYSKDHVFELAEKFEARQQEKKTEIDEKSEEKGSVLKDLKDKQKEAAAKPPVKDAAEKAAKSKGREVL